MDPSIVEEIKVDVLHKKTIRIPDEQKMFSSVLLSKLHILLNKEKEQHWKKQMELHGSILKKATYVLKRSLNCKD